MQDGNYGFGKHFFLSKCQQKHVFKSDTRVVRSIFGFAQLNRFLYQHNPAGDKITCYTK